MAYELVKSGNTQYAVDWTVVRRLVRSYNRAYYQLYYASEVTLSDSHWYNPLSWSLPDITNLEVDWDAVRRSTDASTDDDMKRMQARAKFDAAGVANTLDGMIDLAAKKKEAFIDWMGNVQTQNMKNVDRAVDTYQADIEIAKFIRDRSADGLMVGASIMSGGTALAVMGGGSILKGEAKFQDSGSIGAGIMEGAGSFVFAYVKLGKAFSFKQDMVLAFVQASYKTGTELVAGDSFGDAAVSGALTLTGPGVDRMFELGASKTLFDKIAVPMVITYGKKDVAPEVLRKFAGSMVQGSLIEGAGKKAILPNESRKGSEGSSGSAQSQGAIMSEATLTDRILLDFAFVNMDKGIGRGW